MKLKVLCAGFLLGFLSCNTVDPPDPPKPTEPPGTQNTILLSVDYLTLSSVNIKFQKSFLDTLSGFSYKLSRNNLLIKEFSSVRFDTTFLDDNNGQGYPQGTQLSFKVEAFKDTIVQAVDTSLTLTAEILKPTSHEIEFITDTLSTSGGLLRGIWGINKSNIWVSGYALLQNSYANVIKWNGIGWFPLQNIPGEIDQIWGFNSNQIVVTGEFSNRGYIGMWNGSTWKTYNSIYFYENGDTVYPLHGALWGSNWNDIWAGGFSGTLVHWDGNNWKKYKGLNLSKNFNFWDIWGFGPDCIYAVGNEENVEMALFFYNGKEWKKIFSEFSNGTILPSVWGPHKNLVYIIGYKNYKISNAIISQFYLPNQSALTTRIRGDAENNIFTVGVYGEIFHFNGVNWKKVNYSYPVPKTLLSLQVFGNNIFCSGYLNNFPIVMRSKQ